MFQRRKKGMKQSFARHHKVVVAPSTTAAASGGMRDDRRGVGLALSEPAVINIHAGKRPRRQANHVGPNGVCWPPTAFIHGHEWVVYSTALREFWLMLQCVGCGAMGTIDDPSTEEWSGAFHAPSRPYRWNDDTRVTERGHAAPRVIRAVVGPVCDCPSQSAFPECRGYERVPGGIWEHPNGLSNQDRAELKKLADFVGTSDLCSRFLPLFFRSYEGHTGREHSKATHTIIDRIERWGEKGLHCSPSVVARIIREFAAWDARRWGDG